MRKLYRCPKIYSFCSLLSRNILSTRRASCLFRHFPQTSTFASKCQVLFSSPWPPNWLQALALEINVLWFQIPWLRERSSSSLLWLWVCGHYSGIWQTSGSFAYQSIFKSLVLPHACASRLKSVRPQETLAVTYPRLHVIQGVRERDLEDCVGPTALLIHVGGSYRPGFVTLRHQRLYVLNKSFCSLYSSAISLTILIIQQIDKYSKCRFHTGLAAFSL